MISAESKPGDVHLSPTGLPPTPDHFWKQIIDPIEPFLKKVAYQLGEQVQAFVPEIAAYARYALASQGKQLRPALVVLSGGATGQVQDDHVAVAVIVVTLVPILLAYHLTKPADERT